ncbi:MAG TPA: hypothetical protein VK646_12140 [Actinomycetota bacterium]|nr:hypothetical protein [Actinomycetota bacterium]
MRHLAAVAACVALVLVGTAGGPANATPMVKHVSTAVQGSLYDDHTDAIVVTDSSGKAQAAAMHINFAPGLRGLKPGLFPRIFLFHGPTAMGQMTVLGAEPGEKDYSPVWRVVDVSWNMGMTPTLLGSDDEIDAARAAGKVTTTPRKLLLNAPVIASNVSDLSTVSPPKVFMTFYDAHKDGMLATDVSSKAQAAAKHINFAHQLGTLDPSSFPEIYIVQGRHAPGQLMVLGSEPGEKDYSPLWLETNEHWKKGVKPIVIKSDDQVDALIAQGKLVETGTHIVLDCPVTSTP